jgi:response regulator RpfG family c-di-GMP phosphodiesterase
MKKKIAVIEGNAEYRNMMAQALGKKGLDVATASDGLSGLNLVRNFKPDLVVLEMFLPKLSGFHVISELKSVPDCGDILFIALTSDFGDDFEDENGFKDNADTYFHADMVLRKPFDEDLFLEKVEEIFRVRKDEEKKPKGKVLIVDDDPLIHKLLHHVLQKENFETVWAENGKKGLEMLGSERPDIVLLDLVMPEMDGRETLEGALRIRPDLPIIMITGHGSEKMAVQLMKGGAVDYIPKPFDGNEIIAKVREALNKCGLKAVEKRFAGYLAETANRMLHRLEKRAGLNKEDSGDLNHGQKEEEEKKGKGEKTSISRNEIENIHNILVNYVRYIFAKAKRNEPFHLNEGMKIVNFIIKTPEALDILYGKAMSLKTPTDILFVHSVNVSIHALKVGTAMKFDGPRLLQLGIAGLLHDIGMSKVSKDVTMKNEKLTEEGFRIVRQHPQWGAEILKQLGPDYPWLMETALQEHERENGKGYPQGLAGDRISEFARIIGMVDVYEALTSPRPQRKPLSSFEAIMEIIKSQRGFYWPKAMKVLLDDFSTFPANTYVLLSSGAVAKVVEPNKKAPMTPKVVILFNAKGEGQNDGKTLDLQENPILHVIGSLSEEDLPSKENPLKTKDIFKHHPFFERKKETPLKKGVWFGR